MVDGAGNQEKVLMKRGLDTRTKGRRGRLSGGPWRRSMADRGSLTPYATLMHASCYSQPGPYPLSWLFRRPRMSNRNYHNSLEQRTSHPWPLYRVLAKHHRADSCSKYRPPNEKSGQLVQHQHRRESCGFVMGFGSSSTSANVTDGSGAACLTTLSL